MNIIERLKQCHLTISTAESITGGLIASKICEIYHKNKCQLFIQYI